MVPDRLLLRAALLCVVVAGVCLLLLCVGCAPRCHLQTVGYTDYDATGQVIGHRTQTYRVCRN